MAITAMALTACSWRLETEQPVWPSPDAVTVARDEAAQREQTVIDAIASPDDTTADAVIVSFETTAAPERLAALGGVYVAYPDSSAAPTVSPEPTPSAADAVAAARDGAFAAAVTTTDADLAFLLNSAGLSHGLTAWYADWAGEAFLDAETPVVAERVLDSPALEGVAVVPASTAVETSTLSTLVVEHDRARYLYEVMAAKSADEEREQWLARRDIQAARADLLAALPDVEDARQAVYVVDNATVADAETRTATAQATETDLGEAYAALMNGAEPSEIPWLIGAAFDAYAQAAAYADPSAHDAMIPALPGLTVDASSSQ
ncbi:hypothetical protein [Demequina litorisediminis]|uniref:Uncharacterized protein n=1 Tax=Demequina litorisediminis TaxID=1849022 RepID=A0ABQ6II36_9MICO|nr:hypothetical protein [Demequina litorisediminis]GMA37056.1 hypothetical protein GCM10025876_32600 [Demequina litorisediminis]